MKIEFRNAGRNSTAGTSVPAVGVPAVGVPPVRAVPDRPRSLWWQDGSDVGAPGRSRDGDPLDLQKLVNLDNRSLRHK